MAISTEPTTWTVQRREDDRGSPIDHSVGTLIHQVEELQQGRRSDDHGEAPDGAADTVDIDEYR